MHRCVYMCASFVRKTERKETLREENFHGLTNINQAEKHLAEILACLLVTRLCKVTLCSICIR